MSYEKREHRNIENQKRWKKLCYKEAKYWIDTLVWYDEKLGRYVKYWRGSRSKFIKKECNSKVRRYKGVLIDGGHYKKAAEFWYELY